MKLFKQGFMQVVLVSLLIGTSYSVEVKYTGAVSYEDVDLISFADSYGRYLGPSSKGVRFRWRVADPRSGSIFKAVNFAVTTLQISPDRVQRSPVYRSTPITITGSGERYGFVIKAEGKPDQPASACRNEISYTAREFHVEAWELSDPSKRVTGDLEGDMSLRGVGIYPVVRAQPGGRC